MGKGNSSATPIRDAASAPKKIPLNLKQYLLSFLCCGGPARGKHSCIIGSCLPSTAISDDFICRECLNARGAPPAGTSGPPRPPACLCAQWKGWVRAQLSLGLPLAPSLIGEPVGPVVHCSFQGQKADRSPWQPLGRLSVPQSDYFLSLDIFYQESPKLMFKYRSHY